jgi:hypothetical protein
MGAGSCATCASSSLFLRRSALSSAAASPVRMTIVSCRSMLTSTSLCEAALPMMRFTIASAALSAWSAVGPTISTVPVLLFIIGWR